jgi:glycosyltransferase involved in cell wall biosynthesis
MLIATDARELQGRPTGVGRVLQGLLEAWPEQDEIILCSQESLALPAPLHESGRLRCLVDASWSRAPGLLWEQLTLPRLVRRSGAAALLAPGYGMPLRAGVPTAVCMHDCAPFATPEAFSTRERMRRRWSARQAARRASFLFMGSEFAADEAARHLGCERDRLLVSAWGLTTGFGEATDAEVASARERYGVDERTVLFVGSGFARRDLGTLARRVARVADLVGGARLAVAGTGHGEVAAAEPIVSTLGFVPDPDLRALYAAAGAVAYPSRYEGFGLPVLEALACGTMVVASKATALAEVYDGHALLADHDDDEQWIDALQRALTEAPGLEAAASWARQQTWQPTAAAIRDRLAASTGEPR